MRVVFLIIRIFVKTVLVTIIMIILMYLYCLFFFFCRQSTGVGRKFNSIQVKERLTISPLTHRNRSAEEAIPQPSFSQDVNNPAGLNM